MSNIEKTFDARDHRLHDVPVGFPSPLPFEDRCLQLMQDQIAATREQTSALRDIARILQAFRTAR